MALKKGKSDSLRQLLKEDLLKRDKQVAPDPNAAPNQGGEDMTKVLVEVTSVNVTELSQAVQNGDVRDAIDDAFGGSTVQAIETLVTELANPATRQAGGLDKSLMAEIGKAYRAAHDKFKADNDEKNAERSMGAMQAVKRIMDMMS